MKKGEVREIKPRKEAEIVVFRNRREASDVFTFYQSTVARGDSTTLSQPESSAGTSPGRVELRDRAHQWLWDHTRASLAGEAVTLSSSPAQAEVARMVWGASAKRGKKRREIIVEECFGDLLTGVVERWEGTKELALALDASTPGERIPVLSISVVIGGCAIPVAWHLRKANEPGAWKPHGLRLVERRRGNIPPAWREMVMDGSRAVCGMAHSGAPGEWLASADAGQRERGTVSRRRAGFSPDGAMGAAAWTWVDGARSVQRKG